MVKLELSAKLQIPEGKSVFVVNLPKGLKLNVQVTNKDTVDGAVLVFASNSRVLKKSAKSAVDAAKVDRLSWIAYPKAGKLETDLNRDKLHKLMETYGIEGVRLVSIDDTWSAMRFRAKDKKKKE
jgi:hypothetical protein